MRAMAIDYARDGIRVNNVVLGTTRTPLIETLLSDQERHAGLIAGAPLSRLGTPEDLTGIAIVLASDESRYVTGAMFVVDGGALLR